MRVVIYPIYPLHLHRSKALSDIQDIQGTQITTESFGRG
jgi:hypothetical protein